MMHIFKNLFKTWHQRLFSHTPLVGITISKDRLLHNLHTFQKMIPDTRIAPVLKSNAYGHGLTLVAKIIDNQDVPFIIVDSYHEAIILRNEGIKSKILIIGYTFTENILKNKLEKVAFTITDVEQLYEISKKLQSTNYFHIKIDTGMHRQGIPANEIKQVIELLKLNPLIVPEGICSHLAESDSANEHLTNDQIKFWNETVNIWKNEFRDTLYYHLSATAGVMFSKKIEANVLRLGIGLYGIDPRENIEEKNCFDIRPVLEMKSVISGTKKIPAGEKIGYGSTFTAPRNIRIATIPAGYYEGIDRRLSNKGFIKIGNSFCPIVGRVSMNITTIDISTVPDAKLNTPVTIISANKNDRNSIKNIEKLTGALERELLVHIPQQLRRRVV